MRTLLVLVVLSFHFTLSFSLAVEKIVKDIVKDQKQLSSEFVSTLHETHSFSKTCDCDLQAMNHLKQLLDKVNPKTVSTSDKELLGRIIKNMKAIPPKKKEEENCSRPRRRLRKRTQTAVPYLESLQHWLRHCE